MWPLCPARLLATTTASASPMPWPTTCWPGRSKPAARSWRSWRLKSKRLDQKDIIAKKNFFGGGKNFSLTKWAVFGSIHLVRRGCSSVGRALEWHSRGREFNSPQLHQKIRGLRKKSLFLYPKPAMHALAGFVHFRQQSGRCASKTTHGVPKRTRKRARGSPAVPGAKSRKKRPETGRAPLQGCAFAPPDTRPYAPASLTGELTPAWAYLPGPGSAPGAFG